MHSSFPPVVQSNGNMITALYSDNLWHVWVSVSVDDTDVLMFKDTQFMIHGMPRILLRFSL